MFKNPQSRVTCRENNCNAGNKCPCAGNGNLIRRSERPAFASIQGQAVKSQHLSVQGHAGRRNSDSGCIKRGPSPSTHRQQISNLPISESTRLCSSSRQIPVIKEPLQHGSAIPKRLLHHQPSSTSSYGYINGKNIAAETPIGHHFINSNAIVTSTVKRKATELNPTCMPIKGCCSSTSNTRRTIATSTLLHPTTHSSAYGIASSREPTNNGYSTKRARSISSQSSGYGSASSTVRSSSSSLGSTLRVTTTQPRSYSSGSTLRADSKNFSSASTIVATNSCCSASNSNLPRRSCRPTNYTTLPAQQFVTLTQDTLDPSRCSAIDSMLVGKVNMVRDSSFVPVDITPNFVDGKSYFMDMDQGKCSSTKTVSLVPSVEVTFPVRRSNSISDTFNESIGSRKAAAKMLPRSQKIQIEFPLLYSPEFMEDIIAYSESIMMRFMVGKEMMETYMNKRSRNNIMNWLLQLCDFVVPDFPSIYYMSVRLTDYAIVHLKIRCEYYRLIAAVSFWISIKYSHQEKSLKVSKIQSFCKGHYTKNEIYSMEKKILSVAGYCLNMADPLDFLYYFLKIANLITVEIIRYGSEYILHCCTMFETYCTKVCGFLAACSVYFAVIHCCPDTPQPVYEHLVNVLNCNVVNMEQFIEQEIKRYLRKVVEEKFAVFEQYMTAEKGHVAKFFRSV